MLYYLLDVKSLSSGAVSLLHMGGFMAKYV